MSETKRPPTDAIPPSPRVALSRQGEDILRAVVPAVLGPLLPADPAARAELLEAGLASLDEYVAHLSPPLQRDMQFLFAALHTLPLRVALVRTWRRWPDIAPQRVESFLRRTRESRLFLLRRVYTSLHSLAVIAWFDLPVAWYEIGYPGPPIERPAAAGAPS